MLEASGTQNKPNRGLDGLSDTVLSHASPKTNQMQGWREEQPSACTVQPPEKRGWRSQVNKGAAKSEHPELRSLGKSQAQKCYGSSP